jgi:hypothetical protein
MWECIWILGFNIVGIIRDRRMDLEPGLGWVGFGSWFRWGFEKVVSTTELGMYQCQLTGYPVGLGFIRLDWVLLRMNNPGSASRLGDQSDCYHSTSRGWDWCIPKPGSGPSTKISYPTDSSKNKRENTKDFVFIFQVHIFWKLGK